MNLIIIVLIALTVVILYFIVTYNSFIAFKKQIQAATSEIGNQLKRQAQLIPNLVETAKSYKQYESGIFDKLTNARRSVLEVLEKGQVKELLSASDNLNKIFGQIRVVFESNPELKTSNVYQDLMSNLRDTADKITYARRLLIDLTADYNTSVSSIPSNIIANLAGFKPMEGLKLPPNSDFLEVEKAELENVKVSL